MKKTLTDVICATYESTARNTAWVEKITAGSGRVFSLRMDFPNGQARFELHAEASQTTQSTEPPVIVPNPLMATAVLNGQSFIRFLLAHLNATHLLSELSTAELSVDSPTTMGGTIKTDWGTVSLLLPESPGGDYCLETRIFVPGQPRAKQRAAIQSTIVAQAVHAGDIPLFVALRSCPAAAELLAQHDKFLSAVVEADVLAGASMSSADAPAPRRPRAL